MTKEMPGWIIGTILSSLIITGVTILLLLNSSGIIEIKPGFQETCHADDFLVKTGNEKVCVRCPVDYKVDKDNISQCWYYDADRLSIKNSKIYGTLGGNK